MILGVGVLGDEVPQDHQHAVIGLTQLGDLRRAVLVERPHRVTGDNEDAAPDRDVEPAFGYERCVRRRGQQHRVVPRHQADEQDAAEGGQRRVTPSIEVRRAERRKRVETEHHPLPVDCQVQQQADAEQGQQQPEFLVHFLDATEPRFHLVQLQLNPSVEVVSGDRRRSTNRAKARSTPEKCVGCN